MSGAILAGFVVGTTGGGGSVGGVYDYTEAGTGSVAIPSGATAVTIEVWGAGGGGGKGGTYLIAPGEPEVYDGGGGGGGGYSKTVLALVAGDAAKTINYTVGAGGAGADGGPGTAGGFSNVYSGTFTITTMTANGGKQGTSTPLYTQGDGGTASGGNTTNTTGNGGASFESGGAAGIAGDGSRTAGAGGDGGFNLGDPGSNGRVRMVFTIP